MPDGSRRCMADRISVVNRFYRHRVLHALRGCRQVLRRQRIRIHSAGLWPGRLLSPFSVGSAETVLAIQVGQPVKYELKPRDKVTAGQREDDRGPPGSLKSHRTVPADGVLPHTPTGGPRSLTPRGRTIRRERPVDGVLPHTPSERTPRLHVCWIHGLPLAEIGITCSISSPLARVIDGKTHSHCPSIALSCHTLQHTRVSPPRRRC